MKCKVYFALTVLITALITFFFTKNYLVDHASTSQAAAVQLTPAEADQAAARQMVEKAIKGRATIVEQFIGTGNLIGFVVKGVQPDSPLSVIYADRQGKYFVAGAVVDATGVNVTQRDMGKYIQPKQAVNAFKTVADTAWIEQGSATADHKMYVVVDPSCSACHVFYNKAKPLLDSGQLAVRWIVVGVIRPDSQGRAYAILGAKDPIAALAQNEKDFNVQAEAGGITPDESPSMVVLTKYNTNVNFLKENQIMYTPTMIYRDASGRKVLTSGALADDKFQAMVSAASSATF